MIPREAFPLKKTLDLRQAMAKSLADYLRCQRYPEPDGPTTFAEVFAEWPTADERFVTPAACVLPRGPLKYSEARLTPTLIESTWFPQLQDGWGLYALSDAEIDFEVQVRAPTSKERSDIVSGFETLFVADGVLMDHQQGRRYGRLLTLDAYYGLTARYSLQDVTINDDADAAIRNRREATFVVRAQAKQVRLDVVHPFKVTIKEMVDGLPG